MKWFLTLALCVFGSGALAQDKVPPKAKEKESPAAKKSPERPTPTFADVVYGKDSERQRFDFWQAVSDKPTPVVLLIHGGGWVNGDKTSYGNRPIKNLLEAGVSVAAINYRFIAQAMEQKIEPPVKACVQDAARALQTIRSHATDWNIDPTRIGRDRRFGRRVHIPLVSSS